MRTVGREEGGGGVGGENERAWELGGGQGGRREEVGKGREVRRKGSREGGSRE